MNTGSDINLYPWLPTALTACDNQECPLEDEDSDEEVDVPMQRCSSKNETSIDTTNLFLIYVQQDARMYSIAFVIIIGIQGIFD